MNRLSKRGLALLAGTGSLVFLLAQTVLARVGRFRHSKPVPGSRYALNPGLSLAGALLAFAADLYAIPAILRSKPGIRPRELGHIHPGQVPVYDRVALRQHPGQRAHYKKRSDQLLRMLVASFVILLINKSARRDAWQLFLLYARTHAMAYTFYTFGPIGPAFQDKYRPVVYYPQIPADERCKGNNRNSQYSGHTTNAAAASFFAAHVLLAPYPTRSNALQVFCYLAAALPPALVGYWRMKALKHFPSDVALALLVGAVCGTAVPGAYSIEARPSFSA